MALPVILVDSATGSDTQASGAGPATALFGTTDASTDGTGLIVTLTSGTDLSGVATDGSHVIFLNDSTAGARNFGKITAKAGSGGATPTVTVSNAFGLSLSGKSWAIGGKRAKVATTNSKKLVDNNSAAGDAMPGWAIEMKSAHAETITATFDMRRAGDSTSGQIILRGEAGAATLPCLTFSNDGNMCIVRGAFITLKDFEIKNSAAGKTASIAIQATGTPVDIVGIKCSSSGSNVWKFLNEANGICLTIRDCDIGYCSSTGMTFNTTSVNGITIINNRIHHCGASGMIISIQEVGMRVIGNIIDHNTGDGIYDNVSSTASLARTYIGNVFDANTSDGLEMTQVGSNGSILGAIINNNIFSNNTNYGLNFSGATDIAVSVNAAIIESNCFYGNGTAAANPTLTLSASNSQTVDPQFVSASTGDYTIGTNLKAKGYPLAGTLVIGRSLTSSYVDIGAAQRQESGGGSTVIVIED